MANIDFDSLLQAKPPYEHQLKAKEFILNGESVIIRAPCGSGKTEACVIPFLMGRGDTLPPRLIYSLPTRALVEDIAQRIRKMISNRVSQLQVSCHHGANAEDPFFKNDIIVTTIDQTVGAYCCTPLSLPVHLGNIPAGAVVTSMLCFDEVHTYDHALGLQTVLALVERIIDSKLNLPFVIMSATLPDDFVSWFKERGIRVVEAKEEDIPKRKNRRVVVYWTGKILEPKDVLEKLQEDQRKRIIVVCNTVEKAQKIYEKIAYNLTVPLFLLHSRFLENHRREKLEKMKEIFENKKAACLVTTQVCEVGLDISCDMMLTELTTPDALIQRIGRCAREGGNGEVFVFDVESPAPYYEYESIINNTRNYIREKLNGKVMDWDVELKFVNSLLGEEFSNLMDNKQRRMDLLRKLGDAAFKGEKYEVEKTIREILNSNVTIHDDPERLSYSEMRCMPWISIDTRVLQGYIGRHNPKMWEIEFYDNEQGQPQFKLININKIPRKKVSPYHWYIIDPSYASYDPEIGLKLGSPGQKMEPIKSKEKQEKEKKSQYSKEPWLKHAIECLREFDHYKKNEKYAINRLSQILGTNFEETQSLVALCVGLHDIGKLNSKWQKAAGAKEVPLAHTDTKTSALPPHAGIAAWALKNVISEYIPNRQLGLAFRLAMAHHHHTRTERVPEYEFISDWEQYVGKVVEELEKYGLNVDLNNIIPSSEETQLPESFPDIEAVVKYIVYVTISRAIRVCDRRALGGW